MFTTSHEFFLFLKKYFTTNKEIYSEVANLKTRNTIKSPKVGIEKFAYVGERLGSIKIAKIASTKNA
jgi:hypothetical protein